MRDYYGRDVLRCRGSRPAMERMALFTAAYADRPTCDGIVHAGDWDSASAYVIHALSLDRAARSDPKNWKDLLGLWVYGVHVAEYFFGTVEGFAAVDSDGELTAHNSVWSIQPWDSNERLQIEWSAIPPVREGELGVCESLRWQYRDDEFEVALLAMAAAQQLLRYKTFSEEERQQLPQLRQQLRYFLGYQTESEAARLSRSRKLLV